MINEEKLNELCAKELLELDRHTYGYATAGKDINAVLDRYVIAYKAGYRASERDAQELVLSFQILLNACKDEADFRDEPPHKFVTDCEIELSKWRERGM